MSKDDVIEAEGKVVEALPNATFKVKLSNGHIITAYISGKLRMNYMDMIIKYRKEIITGSALAILLFLFLKYIKCIITL